MAIEYLGLSEINGPLVVLEGVKNASYEEIVEFHMEDGTQKIGRIVEIYAVSYTHLTLPTKRIV